MRARIKGTNTIIDVSWIDGDDYKCCRTGAIYRADELDFDDLGPLSPLMIEKPLEPKIEFMINWEQARINAAIGAMTAMLASPELMEVVTNPSNVVEKSFESRVAKLSTEYADALIAELKK